MVMAEMRALRDRPEPFSITRSGASIPRACSQLRTAAAPVSGLAGAGDASLASVNSNWRAITLLLNLLISVMTWVSGGDCHSPTRRASGGTTPSRTLPLNVPPISVHSRRNTAPKKAARLIWYGCAYNRFSPQA